MKKVDIKEKTRLLNEFIQKTGKNVLTRKELVEGLSSLTKCGSVICNLLKLFPYETIGRSKMYEMPKEPIYMALVENCWNKQRESCKRSARKARATVNDISEEQAIEKLKGSGFIVRKIVGFDMERFIKDHPDLYRKYCKYEYV